MFDAAGGDLSFTERLSSEDKVVLRKLFLHAHRGTPERRFLKSLIPNDVVPYGPYRIRLFPRENYTDLQIWLKGHPPEPYSVTALLRHVHENRCLICDIGANSGSYTLMLAGTAGPGSAVLAFDPNPVMVERLAENLRLNGLEDRVTIHQVALSDSEGQAELSAPPGNYGEATLQRTLRRVASSFTVPTAPLAKFIPDLAAFDKFAIKIDVEGHEDHVLGPYLSTAPDSQLPDVILIETAHKQNWATDLTSLIVEKGYQATFEGEGNTLYTLRKE